MACRAAAERRNMVVLRVVLLAGLAAIPFSPARAGGSDAARALPESPARLVAPAGVTQVFAGPAGASQMVAQYDPDAPRDVIVRFSATPLGRRARLAADVADRKSTR